MTIAISLSKKKWTWIATLGTLSLLACTSIATHESTAIPEYAKKRASKRPLVIAHRGASGYLPEHTLEAYIRAMEMGADFVEPDLVMTKDGVLVARHENNIDDTTNAAQVYPERKATKTIDGKKVVGWFAEDFTLDELRKLKAKQRLAFRPQMQHQPFLIPTLVEIIDAVDQYNAKTGKTVGIFPEIKHSTYFRSIGLNIENELLKVLEEKKWNTKLDQVYIQSFEVGNLRELAVKTKYSLVQLIGDPTDGPYDLNGRITYQSMVTLDGLKAIRKYATALGPYKKYLIEDSKNKVETAPAKDLAANGLVVNDVFKNAQLLEFEIFPYTFRNESFFVLKPLVDPIKEYEFFYKMGVQGVFSDFPDTAIKALKILEEPIL